MGFGAETIQLHFSQVWPFRVYLWFLMYAITRAVNNTSTRVIVDGWKYSLDLCSKHTKIWIYIKPQLFSQITYISICSLIWYWYHSAIGRKRVFSFYDVSVMLDQILSNVIDVQSSVYTVYKQIFQGGVF